ncbi:MAG: hypothetical protein LBG04_02390 [Holosporaceae bacterium]|jgi:hypothetical protein|nr:hypothetical protein [Holosporaceae bacterium]
MMTYGLKKYESAHLQSGFDKDGNASRIIDFDSDMNAQQVCTGRSTRKKLFKKEFREMASTSVGRVLLYRQLMEIRRKTTNDDCSPVDHLEDGIVISSEYLNMRNSHRSITIKWGNDNSGNLLDLGNGRIEFFAKNPVKEIGIITRKQETAYMVERVKRPDNVGIFREMLHWFHFLRHPLRFYIEADKIYDTVALNEIRIIDGITVDLGSIYFGSLRGDDLKNSERHWDGLNSEGKRLFKMEEIRNILGNIRKDGNASFLEGDDLSENLYRLCIGLLLRYGHNNSCKTEHEDVINVVKSVCDASLQKGNYQKVIY